MAVFLTVLKILGLVLLSVIALVLFIVIVILTLVFTVPVKYWGHLEVDDDVGFEIVVHWLLKAVYARLAVGPDGQTTQVRLLGKDLELGGEMTIDMVLDFLFPPVDDETIARENREDQLLNRAFKADFERAVADEEDFIEEEASPDTFLSRATDFFLEKTSGIREKYKKLKRQKRFLSRKRVKHALTLILEFVKKVIGIVFPKELCGEVLIGFESPADTGTFLAASSMLLPLTKEKLVITPDFEKQAFEASLDFATSVRIGGLVIAVVKFILNKYVRYFMRRVRKYL